MKRHIIIMAAAVLAVLLVSCTENRSVTDVKGSYSYKTSGTILVGEESVTLANESGQMEIVSLHDGDSILMTMNQMGGETFATKGVVNDDGEIGLVPFTRRMTVAFDTTRLITYPAVEEFDVTVSGGGRYYDGTIVLDLRYEGRSTVSEHTFRSEKVTMIGRRN